MDTDSPVARDLPPVEDIAQAPLPPTPVGSLARMLTERPDGDEPDAGPVEAPPVPTPRERAAVILAAALVAVAAWCTAARATASAAALPQTVDILAALAAALADPRPRALESVRLHLAAWVHAAERQWFADPEPVRAAGPLLVDARGVLERLRAADRAARGADAPTGNDLLARLRRVVPPGRSRVSFVVDGYAAETHAAIAAACGHVLDRSIHPDARRIAEALLRADVSREAAP